MLPHLVTHVEAEMDKTGSTITFILTTLDVLGFLEDTDYQKDLGPEDVTDIRENTTTSADIISQMAQDHIYDVSPPPHGNSQHEIVKDYFI